MSLFVNGTKTDEPWLANINKRATALPPTSLTTQHSWNELHFPSLDLVGVVDVRAMGAVGDGLHDDTAAIQKALDTAGAVVLLAKGLYRISRTLNMAAGGATTLLGRYCLRTLHFSATSLAFKFYPASYPWRTLSILSGDNCDCAGVARHLSVIMPVSDGLVQDAAAVGAEGAAPILRVSNPSDRIVISMFTIVRRTQS